MNYKIFDIKKGKYLKQIFFSRREAITYLTNDKNKEKSLLYSNIIDNKRICKLY